MTRRPWEPEGEATGRKFREIALAAIARGWSVFPCQPNGKQPLTAHGYKDATKDPAQVEAWADKWPDANLGIATGEASGVSVVDVDVKGGRPGESNAMKLGLPLLDTYAVRTASGGWHYYFKHTDGFRCRTGILEGIDTRGDGGYVIGEGSVIDGELYEQSNVADVQPMPHSVLNLIEPAPAKPWQPPAPDSEAFDLGDDELKRFKAAIGYLDADDYETWTLAGMALYEATGGAEQLFKVWDHWSAGSAKYDAAIMRRKWASFASDRPDKVTESTFWRLAREAGYSDPGDGLTFRDDTAGRLAFSMRELIAWQEPKLEHIELWHHSVIARGNMTLIAGPPKVGKSLLIQHLLTGAAIGADFLGEPFPKPLKVLWFQAEVRKVYLKLNRIVPATNSMGLDAAERELLLDNFHMTDRLDLELTTPREFELMAATIKDLRPDIIVIDPVINFSAAEENDAKETKDMLRAARKLARAAGENAEAEPALVIVHHTKKIDPKRGVGPDPFELIRGSGAFRGYYDAGMMLLPDSSGHLGLHFETRNERSPEPIGLRFDDDASRWELAKLAIRKRADGKFSGIQGEDRATSIIAMIEGVDEPYYITATELRERVEKVHNLKNRAATNAIAEAVEQSRGTVIRAGGGPKTIYYAAKHSAFVQSKLEQL